jgi:hypothetical protein
MRTIWTMQVFALGAALAAGCDAGPIPTGSVELAVRADDGLPSCSRVNVAASSGAFSVEDVAGTDRMILRVGEGERSTPLCSGNFEEVFALLASHTGEAHRAAAGADPIRAAAHDDGRHTDGDNPSASDPMPATGGRPIDASRSAASDPMPATGSKPAGSDPMPAETRPHSGSKSAPQPTP